MTVRSHSLLAAALGLCLAHPLFGQEPGRLAVERGQNLVPPAAPSVNQQLANTIAEQLRQSGQLRHYDVNISVNGGTAEVSGTVADQAQREEVLRLVQGVAGVERAVDHLTLAGSQPITRVQADVPPAQPPGGVEPAPLPRSAEPPVPLPPPGQPAEPLPMFGAPAPPPGSPLEAAPPRMPPYAWPTYAPYNNYSRVAYPLAYPYNAFPYIGPVYPFPKIPLGWRRVKLEWQDGHWWFSKVACKYDWWRLRYW